MALGDPYVSLTELKAQLHITDTGDDTQITLAVNAASRWIERHCGRQFNLAASATARYYRPDRYGRLEVDDIASTTGLVVKTDDNDDGTFETTWASTDYELVSLGGSVGQVTGWPYTQLHPIRNRTFPYGTRDLPVEVTATWGWAAVPQDVKQAAMIQAARLFKRRESSDGILGGFDEFTPIRVGTRIDPDVAALLAPYVNMRGWLVA